MSSMFDVVLSFLIGGMLLISMFTAMTTIQAHAINQKIYFNMMANSLNVGKILKGYYLARLGIKHTGNPITSATSNSFRFWTYIVNPSTGSESDMDVTIAERVIGGQKAILVYRANHPAQRLYGPFNIDNNGLVIRYYDKDDNIITNPSANLSAIRAVEIGFHRIREGINISSNSPFNITNYVYFKKYLINLF